MLFRSRWDAARDIYRWMTPLLHLDVSTKLVQNLKLIDALVGVGTEHMRRPRLPFPAIAVVSSDDPYCAPERAAGLCADWGAERVDAGPRGHLNAASGLGDWPEGRALLRSLVEPVDDDEA